MKLKAGKKKMKQLVAKAEESDVKKVTEKLKK